MSSSSKAILLLAFVAVFGAARAFSSDDTVKQADSTFLFSEHHGDLRAPQQACQSEADTLLACLGLTSTEQACIDCVLAIDEELFITGSALCVDIESVMCDAWTNVCPCSPCEEEWEAYYLGCLYSDCLSMGCPTVDPCEDLFVEANSCVTSSAPFSCGGCVETAINDLNFTTMPCKDLETKICDITSVDCSCSPCEQGLQEYYFCSASDRCEDLGPCTMPTIPPATPPTMPPTTLATNCDSLIAGANSCEMQFEDSSICVECMVFVYGVLTPTDCTAAKEEFCAEIASDTNFCNCHAPCYNQVALAVSCGTDCEGMTCTTQDPIPSQEECEEALATVNECFAQCVF